MKERVNYLKIISVSLGSALFVAILAHILKIY